MRVITGRVVGGAIQVDGELEDGTLVAVIAALREQVPALGADRYMAGDLAKAAALVEADALPAVAIAALSSDPFPRLA